MKYRLLFGFIVVLLGCNLSALPFGQSGVPLTLLYNTNAFAIRNDSTWPVELGDMTLTRDEASFAGATLADSVLPNRACMVILLQRDTASIPEAWNCEGRIHSQQFRLDVPALFWRNIGSEQFEVWHRGWPVAACPTLMRGGEGECRVTWPAIAN